MPVVFENVKMHEVLYIPSKGKWIISRGFPETQILFSRMLCLMFLGAVGLQCFYQRGTGWFEISLCDEERVVVNGTARVADFDASTDQWITPEIRESMLNNLDKSMERIESSFQLEAQDIYSLFERRGNTFASSFRALENLTLCERGKLPKRICSYQYVHTGCSNRVYLLIYISRYVKNRN